MFFRCKQRMPSLPALLVLCLLPTCFFSCIQDSLLRMALWSFTFCPAFVPEFMLFHLYATKSFSVAAWGEWSIHSLTFVSFSYIFPVFFSAVYKGFLPCWLRMAPWSLTFWLSYEQIRKNLGAAAW
jgi:hypothetical protein